MEYMLNTALTDADLLKMQVSGLETFRKLVYWGWFSAAGRSLQWYDHLTRRRE